MTHPSPVASRRWAQSIAAPVRAALAQPWVAGIVRRGTMEEVLNALHPMLSLGEVRARVIRVIDETADTKTFVLRPNAFWQGAQAGQFVRVRLEIDGRFVERVYSASSLNGTRELVITIKRQPGGLFSQYMHDTIKRGAVLTISQAAGEFVLPAVLPAKMLLLSAGSGVTPMRAILQELQVRNYAGDVLLLHVAPSAAAFIFGKELASLASTFPALRILPHYTQTVGHLNAEQLRAQVPDLAERATWLCGPAGMMAWVHALWEAEHYAAPLRSERFASSRLLPASAPGTPVAVTFSEGGQQFTTQGNDTLLVQAERAGLTPKHGCRIGICATCQCIKQSGTVENLQTGKISDSPDELIRLCVSVARSDISIKL